MQKIIYRIIFAAVGFTVSCIALLLLYWLLQFMMDLFDVRHTRFRAPVFLIFLPLVGAWYGFSAGSELAEYVHSISKQATPLQRLLIATSGFWTVCVLGYVFVFAPFGYRISEYEWFFVGKIISFPIVLLVAGYFLFFKFVLSK